MDSYKTISKSSSGEFKDKGSKFLSYTFPANSEDECKKFIEQVRKEHPKSRHVCYAYRVGTQEPLKRINDAGEPSGTAGKPILGQIYSYNLNNLVIVVVRYFGGTKLGVSGLINAYKSAAANAIAANKIISKKVKAWYKLLFNYTCYHELMNYLNKENVAFIEQKMDTACELVIALDTSNTEQFEKNISNFKDVEFSFVKYE